MEDHPACKKYRSNTQLPSAMHFNFRGLRSYNRLGCGNKKKNKNNKTSCNIRSVPDLKSHL